MADRTVSVLLKAQVDGFTSNMKKAEAATKTLDDKLKATIKSHQNMARVAEVVGTVGALAIGKQLVNAASDLNETLSKTQVVFGKNSDAVISWSKTTATSLGMSQQQAAEAAATFGNLFVGMKMGTKPAADMSTRLVQLAGDLASFNNTNPADALEALRSGLVGETEPLRRYGVNLNDAELRQKALSMGLVTTTTAVLPPAIRAQAAYAMILDQTKTAQGDFARTSDGLANSQRIFSAELANAQANLGRAFLPTVQGGVHVLNDFLGAFNALPAPVQNVLVLTGTLSAGLAVAAPRITATKAALDELGISSKVTGLAMKGLAAATAVLAVIAIVQDFQQASAALDDFDAKLRDITSKPASTQGIDDLRQSVLSLSHDLQSPGIIRGAREGIDWYLKQITGNATEMDRMQGQLDSAAASYAKFTEATGNAAMAMGTTTSRAQELAVAAGVNLSDPVDVTTQKIIAYAKSSSTGSAASKTAAAALNVLGDKTASVTDRLKALQDQWDATVGGMLGVSDATINAEQALDDMTKSLKDNKNEWKLTDAAGRANQGTLNRSIQSFEDLRQKLIETGQATEQQANAKMVSYLTQLRDELPKSAKGARRELDSLIAKYAAIPAGKSTKVTADTSQARSALAGIAAQIAALRTKVQVDVRAGTQGTGGGRTAGNATGGKIVGPGTSTSDSITRNVSNGEWVIRAAAASKYGDRTMAAINAGTWSPPAFATTPVQAASGSVMPMLVAGNGVPVVLQLDGQAVVTAILRVKRARGGVTLGIG